MQDTEVGQRRKKERSPSYPGIDLEAAIERADRMRAREGRNWAPVDTVLSHWGYSPKSGPGLVAVAALKKFGLLEERGSGNQRLVRLTDLARAILLDDRPESPDRQAAIREAALSPAVHAELLQEYGDSLPSDSTLSYQLRHKRGFTDVAAKAFIPQLKATLAYAGLPKSDSISTERVDTSVLDNGQEPYSDDGLRVPRPHPGYGRQEMPVKHETPVSDPATRTIQLPLSLTEWATLEAAFPLSETKWDQMLAVLHAMKPALVGSTGPEQSRSTGQRETHEEGRDY